MYPKFDCTVIGDALIDILLPLNGMADITSLQKGGVVNTKAHFTMGGIANVAYYISRLGGKAAAICKVGNDYFGQLFTRDLAQNQVTGHLGISETESTGMSFVVILPDGERFFIDDRGANPGLSYDDFDIDLADNSKFLYISGYSFQDDGFLPAVSRLFEEIGSSTSIVFSPGAPNLAERYRDIFLDIIRKYANIVILNEAEARNLTALTPADEMLDKLLSVANIAALTLGAGGSIVANHRERIIIPADKVKIVDTTGAGDGYAGALLYGLAQGWTLKKAGELAGLVAAEVVGCQGARAVFPRVSELM